MKKIAILYILLLNNLGFCQDKRGFYNSKFLVSVESLVSTPFFYNVYGSNYVSPLDNNLQNKPSKLNLGFRGSVGVILKRNRAFHLELGYDQSRCYTPKYMNYSIDYDDIYGNHQYEQYGYDVKIESLKSRSFYFLPKFEITNKNGILPLGLTHSFGIGYIWSTIIKKEYNAVINAQDVPSGTYTSVDSLGVHHELEKPLPPNFTDINNKLIDYENQKPNTYLQLMYAITIRKALTKNLFISYGLRYTFNFANIFQYRSSSIQYKGGSYLLDDSNLHYSMNRQKSFNFINFSLGVTYAF